MSMADDSRQRSYRSNEPYRRTGESSRPNEQASDPLAELARLIGRSDPFAELGRTNSRQGQSPQQAPQYAPPAPDDWPHAPQQDQRYTDQRYADQRYDDQRYASDDRPRRDTREPNYDPNYGSNQDYAAGQDYPPATHGRDDRQQDQYEDRHQDRYQESRDYRDDYRQQASPRYDEVEADPRSSQYGEQQYGAHPGQHYDPRYEEQQQHGEHQGQQYTDDDVADDRAQRGVQQHEGSDHYFEDDAALEPHEDAMYDDAPRARRHGGLATALALIGCAMLGTAGAYAYRSYYGQPGSTQPPPTITADNSTPTKIVPATAGDPQSSKAIEDKLANAGKEQIVTKQEEPVALRELGTQQTPRVVLPAPVAPAPPGTLPSGGNEPRKVKTVTIRPDGNDVSGRPVGAPLPAQPATRSVAPPAPAPKATEPGRNGGPISLEPQRGEPPAAAAPAPRARTAAAPAVEATASTGGFMVQLSSQKSESEAQASFRSLQQKFPNELGDRQPVIRRADLGSSKGVVYRAMVGPFASSQEAQQFCSSYKTAGGQCLVPNNN
jgi:hypothetical protein